MFTFALISHAFLPLLALAGPTPVPYQWGVYKPVDGKVIIVDWNSPEGRKRLARSKYNQDFYQAAHAYAPQINPVYATVASAVLALNALRLPKHTIASQEGSEVAKPPALGGGFIPFPAYSQATFLNAETDKIKDRKLILLQNVNSTNQSDKSAFKPGLGLDDLSKMLETVYGARGKVTFADGPIAEGSAAFRKTLKQVANDKTRFILANFKGDTLGASTEGTVSPVVAYDAASDSVLVLDVTGHKNPWYWVPLVPFYESMHTQYDGTWRGYIEVSDKN